jgi:hypothetical protein
MDTVAIIVTVALTALLVIERDDRTAADFTWSCR